LVKIILFESENIFFVPSLVMHVKYAHNFFYKSVIGMTIELSRKVTTELK